MHEYVHDSCTSLTGETIHPETLLPSDSIVLFDYLIHIDGNAVGGFHATRCQFLKKSSRGAGEVWVTLYERGLAPASFLGYR
jgi:hypothetical protein